MVNKFKHSNTNVQGFIDNMFPRLCSITLINFKSFQGRTTIGPFEDFTVLVGSNHLGKFHIIDSLNYALRAHSTFIGSTPNQPSPDGVEVSVEVKAKINANRDVVLKRTATHSGAFDEFQINGNKVSQKAYEKCIAQLCINQLVPFIYDRHSLLEVFTQSPVKCAEMFERYCGSFRFKDDTDVMEKRLQASKENLEYINSLQWMMYRKHKNMQRRYNDYDDKKSELTDLKVTYYMLGLHLSRFDIRHHVQNLRLIEEQLRMEQDHAIDLQQDLQRLEEQRNTLLLQEMPGERAKLLLELNNEEHNASLLKSQLRALNMDHPHMPTAEVDFDTLIQQNTLAFELLKYHDRAIGQHNAHLEHFTQFSADTKNRLAHNSNECMLDNPATTLTNDFLNCETERHTHEWAASARHSWTQMKAKRLELDEVCGNRLQQLRGVDGVSCLRDDIQFKDGKHKEMVKFLTEYLLANRLVCKDMDTALKCQTLFTNENFSPIELLVVGSDSVVGGLPFIQFCNSSHAQAVKVSLGAIDMRVSTFNEDARRISSNPVKNESSITLNGTIYNRRGSIIFKSSLSETAAPDIRLLRSLSDFRAPITLTNKYPVNEASLLQPPAKLADGRLHEVRPLAWLAVNSPQLEQTVSGDASLNAIRGNALQQRRDRLNEEIHDAQTKLESLREQVDVADLFTNIEKVKASILESTELYTEITKKIEHETWAVDDAKIKYHEILVKAKERNMEIPLAEGSIEDLTEDVHSADGLVVDFHRIEPLIQRQDINITTKSMKIKIDEMTTTFRTLTEMEKAPACLNRITESRRQLNLDGTHADKEHARAARAYREICDQRSNTFDPFYSHMTRYLPASYIDLMADDTAQIFVYPYDEQEAIWKHGVLLDAIVPGQPYMAKPTMPNDDVALVALATLFTMFSFENTASFVVLNDLDEMVVDDRKFCLLVEYLSKRSKDMQIIVLSDKHDLFEKATSLIGLLIVDDLKSQAVTLKAVN